MVLLLVIVLLSVVLVVVDQGVFVCDVLCVCVMSASGDTVASRWRNG